VKLHDATSDNVNIVKLVCAYGVCACECVRMLVLGFACKCPFVCVCPCVYVSMAACVLHDACPALQVCASVRMRVLIRR